MGRCQEFGSQIRDGCNHTMDAGQRACSCPECGVVCPGQFDGCPEVWARGPRPVALTAASPVNGTATRMGALNAGRPAPPPPPPPPPPRAEAPPTNGHAPPPPRPSGGRASAAGSGSAVADPRADVFRWFEESFDDIRTELHAVVSTMTRQQAMLAELLDARDAELRVVMVAESLPEQAGEAVARVLASQSTGLAETVGAYLQELKASVRSSDEANAAVMDGMRELLSRVELQADVRADLVHREGADRLEALKASVTKQLRPVSGAVAEMTAQMDEAAERELARARALKASVTKQIQPLAAALDAAVERSDRQMALILERLDAIAPAGPAPAPSPPAARRRVAPVRDAEPAPVRAKRAKATKPAAKAVTKAAKPAGPPVAPKPAKAGRARKAVRPAPAARPEAAPAEAAPVRRSVLQVRPSAPSPAPVRADRADSIDALASTGPPASSKPLTRRR